MRARGTIGAGTTLATDSATLVVAATPSYGEPPAVEIVVPSTTRNAT